MHDPCASLLTCVETRRQPASALYIHTYTQTHGHANGSQQAVPEFCVQYRRTRRPPPSVSRVRGVPAAYLGTQQWVPSACCASCRHVGVACVVLRADAVTCVTGCDAGVPSAARGRQRAHQQRQLVLACMAKSDSWCGDTACSARLDSHA